MTRSSAAESIVHHNHKLWWTDFLPQRKAWIQALILLPFGLSVANFLAISWRFSVTSMLEGQYLLSILSMGFNLLLPSLFFAVLLHWGWFIWRGAKTWYPQLPALRTGCVATIAIAVSFGVVGVFTANLGICGNSAWGSIGDNLLCNLDDYGFRPKSLFGAWLIVAAYFYQVQTWLGARSSSIFLRRRYLPQYRLEDTATPEDFNSNAVEAIGIEPQD